MAVVTVSTAILLCLTANAYAFYIVYCSVVGEVPWLQVWFVQVNHFLWAENAVNVYIRPYYTLTPTGKARLDYVFG